jgi:DNA mismatch endonuclease (patch repair protein)
MVDQLTPEERSAHMRRIRQRDTTPEMAVRCMAHALGARFRLHRRDLPGTPDLIFPRYRKAIQVHGCFWHRHDECRIARIPKSRVEYWQAKLDRNVERDRRALDALKAMGWQVLVVWECETRDTVKLRGILSSFLDEHR